MQQCAMITSLISHNNRNTNKCHLIHYELKIAIFVVVVLTNFARYRKLLC